MSYKEVLKLLNEIRQYTKHIPFIIIGNKIDLLKEFDSINFRKKAEALAREESSIYIETSAKTGENVERTFRELTRRIIDKSIEIDGTIERRIEEVREREKKILEREGEKIIQEIETDKTINRKIEEGREREKKILEREEEKIIQEIETEKKRKREKWSSLKNEFYQLSENQQTDFLLNYKDQIIKKSEEILKSIEYGIDFRFIIAGNEESQKPFLIELFSLEGIEWPPRALTILYNSSNFRMQFGKTTYGIQILFLSNIKKLNEDRKLFLSACKNSDGIIFFYNQNDPEDFMNTVNLCTQLRQRFPLELEITLTAGAEDTHTLYEQKEKIKRYGINLHNDYGSLLPKMIFKVMERKKIIEESDKKRDLQFEKAQLQLNTPGTPPSKIPSEMVNIVLNDLVNQDVNFIQDLYKNLIFVSYSHKDKEWLDRIQTFLKPLETEGIISRWDDTRIKSGDLWREEIIQSLNNSKAAILLISANFLASDFISKNELPPLLEAARNRGTAILPLIISASWFEEIESLSRFQSINNPNSEALVKLSEGEQAEVLVRLTKAVKNAFKSF
jgi:hypothetical protein